MQRRHEHAAERAPIIGQGGRARVAQLAVDQLALDLQPDDEEEHGHQPVVDPVDDRASRVNEPTCEADLGVPERR